MSHFGKDERMALLAVKGVGPTILERLEDMGITNFTELSTRTADDICAAVSATLGSTCWKNSPQAKAAINAAIERAKEGIA